MHAERRATHACVHMPAPTLPCHQGSSLNAILAQGAKSTPIWLKAPHWHKTPLLTNDATKAQNEPRRVTPNYIQGKQTRASAQKVRATARTNRSSPKTFLQESNKQQLKSPRHCTDNQNYIQLYISTRIRGFFGRLPPSSLRSLLRSMPPTSWPLSVLLQLLSMLPMKVCS